jgi:hypothetical protein
LVSIPLPATQRLLPCPSLNTIVIDQGSIITPSSPPSPLGHTIQAAPKVYPPPQRIFDDTTENINPHKTNHNPLPCGPCRSGACSFKDCGVGELDKEPATCNGGLCEITHSTGATCDGGACVFIECEASECQGGGCHHVNPRDTLREGFCEGGGCLLNGGKVPHNMRKRLTV